MGNLVALDDSTKSKLSFDVGRALIKTFSTNLPNATIKVKINQHIHTIRLLEEPFSGNVFQPSSERMFPDSDDSSSEDSDCILDSLERI